MLREQVRVGRLQLGDDGPLGVPKGALDRRLGRTRGAAVVGHEHLELQGALGLVDPVRDRLSRVRVGQEARGGEDVSPVGPPGAVPPKQDQGREREDHEALEEDQRAHGTPRCVLWIPRKSLQFMELQSFVRCRNRSRRGRRDSPRPSYTRSLECPGAPRGPPSRTERRIVRAGQGPPRGARAADGERGPFRRRELRRRGPPEQGAGAGGLLRGVVRALPDAVSRSSRSWRGTTRAASRSGRSTSITPTRPRRSTGSWPCPR